VGLKNYKALSFEVGDFVYYAMEYMLSVFLVCSNNKQLFC
jgi:hypothetical protein